MAAGIFEDQDIQGGGFVAPPQQAVAPAPSAATGVASALQSLSGMFSGVQGGIQAGQKQAKENVQNQALSEYARTVTGLNAAVEQGKMSKADAQRRQRASFNQIVANNPAMTDDLTKFNSSITGSAGLGDTLAKGTAVDQQIDADTKSATAAGFINPGMTPAQQENGLNGYRTQQKTLNDMNFYSQQLELKQKQLSIVNTQESIANNRTQRANAAYDLNIKRNKQGVQTALSDYTSNFQQKVVSQIGIIQDKLTNKQITPEQALQETQAIRNGFYTGTQAVRGAAGGDYVDSLASPVMKTLDAADNMFSGKVSSEVAQNQLDHATTTAQLPFMSNPKMAGVVAASKLFQNIPAFLMGDFGPDIVNIINKNSNPQSTPHNPVSNDPDDSTATKQYTDSIKATIGRLTGKDPSIDDPKGLQADLQVNVNQLLKGVGQMGMSVDNPKDFNNVVDFFASPSFLDFQKHGGTIDEANRGAALNVVREQYMNQVVPVMKDAWNNSKTVTGYPTTGTMVGRSFVPTPTQDATTDAVTYRWNGKSIVFQPNKGMERNSGAIAKSRELNQKLAPLVQKMVMMEAHMEGNNDYTKYFKEQEANIFGSTQEPTDGQ